MKITKRKGTSGRVESVTVTWAPGEAEPVAVALADRCVQVVGDFAGGAVAIEGSNDGEHYVTLTDAPGSIGRLLALSVAGIRAVAENPAWVRPSRKGAAETTVILVGRPR